MGSEMCIRDRLKTSDIGLSSSSAKNDPILSEYSKDGVSSGSAPNFIKFFSITFKSCFFKTNFLFQRSSNPDGKEGLSFLSFSILVVLWVGYAPTTSDPQTDVILFHHQGISFFVLSYFVVI